MIMQSPGWETDLEILRLTGSSIDVATDYVVVRTAENPNYHWGNCLLVLDPERVDEPGFWIERFEAEFPDKDWIAIGLPVMPNDITEWKSQGITLEKLDVLSSEVKPRQFPLADGYTSRQFQPEDWPKLIRRETQEALSEGGYQPEVIEEFIAKTNQARQELCLSGHAAWFGVFHGDDLVSNLGIIKCASTGRYQSVETVAEHRRKGLASHLLGLAASWSHDQGCDKWVIVTQETNDAGRVYRRAGFGPDLAVVNAYRKPADA